MGEQELRTAPRGCCGRCWGTSLHLHPYLEHFHPLYPLSQWAWACISGSHSGKAAEPTQDAHEDILVRLGTRWRSLLALVAKEQCRWMAMTVPDSLAPCPPTGGGANSQGPGTGQELGPGTWGPLFVPQPIESGLVRSRPPISFHSPQ